MVPLPVEHMPPVGTVYLYHQLVDQLARFSVAVVCPTDVAVRPTVEKAVAVASSVAQLLSLYAL